MSGGAERSHFRGSVDPDWRRTRHAGAWVYDMHRVDSLVSGEDWLARPVHAEKPSQRPEIRLYSGAGRLLSVPLEMRREEVRHAGSGNCPLLQELQLLIYSIVNANA